jgi:hypothetical protein
MVAGLDLMLDMGSPEQPVLDRNRILGPSLPILSARSPGERVTAAKLLRRRGCSASVRSALNI